MKHKIPIEITPKYVLFEQPINKFIFQADLQKMANKMGIGRTKKINKKNGQT